MPLFYYISSPFPILFSRDNILVLCLAACSNANNNETKATERNGNAGGQNGDGTENVNDGNILIVYFTAAENSGVYAISSASVVTIDGTTRGMSQAIAEMIAENTGGDLFSVQTSVVYPADFNELLDYASNEQRDGVIPELTTHIENLDDYDTVFVGFPIWWYDIPQAMSAFFEEYDFSDKTIIPFVVYNISSLYRPIANIQALEPDATVIMNGLAINQRVVADAAESVADWLIGLGYK